jgi:hypothetical protein
MSELLEKIEMILFRPDKYKKYLDTSSEAIKELQKIYSDYTTYCEKCNHKHGIYLNSEGQTTARNQCSECDCLTDWL